RRFHEVVGAGLGRPVARRKGRGEGVVAAPCDAALKVPLAHARPRVLERQAGLLPCAGDTLEVLGGLHAPAVPAQRVAVLARPLAQDALLAAEANLALGLGEQPAGHAVPLVGLTEASGELAHVAVRLGDLAELAGVDSAAPPAVHPPREE